MTAPFADQGEAAVCARVALALIRLERRRKAPDEVKPLILIGMTVERLHGLRLATVRLALLSIAVWVGEQHRTDDWLKGVLLRDYYGLPIRRCYYAEYKATRRDDPRVTNRGVITPAAPAGSEHKKQFTKNDGAHQ